jgi:hypothetical protein
MKPCAREKDQQGHTVSSAPKQASYRTWHLSRALGRVGLSREGSGCTEELSSCWAGDGDRLMCTREDV